MPAFPVAVPIKPIYRIQGRLWRRVPNAEGQSDPDAIRAAIDIKTGRRANEKAVCWFVKVPPEDLPEPEKSTKEPAPAGK